MNPKPFQNIALHKLSDIILQNVTSFNTFGISVKRMHENDRHGVAKERNK